MEDNNVKKKKSTKKKTKSTITTNKKTKKKEKQDLNFEKVAFRFDDGRSGVNINAIIKTCAVVIAFIIVISAVLIFKFIKDSKNKNNSLYLESTISGVSEQTTEETMGHKDLIKVIAMETEPIKDKEIKNTIEIRGVEEETTEKEIIIETTEKEITKETTKEKQTEKETTTAKSSAKETTTAKQTEKETTTKKLEEETNTKKESAEKKLTENVRKLTFQEIMPKYSSVLYSEAAFMPYTIDEMKDVKIGLEVYTKTKAYNDLSNESKYIVSANMKFIDSYISTYNKLDHEKYLNADNTKYLQIVKNAKDNIGQDDSKFYYRKLPIATMMSKFTDKGFYYELANCTYNKDFELISEEKICVLKNARLGYTSSTWELAKDYLSYPETITYEMYATAEDVCTRKAKNQNLLFDALVSQEQVFDNKGFVVALVNKD